MRWREGPLVGIVGGAVFLVAMLLPGSALAVMLLVQHGHRVGLDVVAAEQATVVGLEPSGGSRRSCPGVWVEVRWAPSGEGRFRSCEDSSLATVSVGDQLTVRPNPIFGSEVLPEDEPVDWLAPVIVVVAAMISVGTFRSIRDWWRLATVGPAGEHLAGEIVSVDPTTGHAAMRVDGDGRRLHLRRARKGSAHLDLEPGAVDVWQARQRPRWLVVDRWLVVQGDRRWCAHGSFETARDDRGGNDPTAGESSG